MKYCQFCGEVSDSQTCEDCRELCPHVWVPSSFEVTERCDICGHVRELGSRETEETD